MPEVEICFDRARIDFRATSDLIMASYWGASRTDAINRRAFENSFCAAAFIDGQQIGFGRAITDACVFGYLADVIVWPDHRSKGIGQKLVQALIDHPDLAEVGHWCLTTADAQGLYERFGFRRSTDGRYMRLDRHGGPAPLTA